MAYHRLPNIGETLQGDIVGKIRKGIGSENIYCEFNFNYTTKVNGTCAYVGECRAFVLVYKVTSKQCRSVYVGNTFKNSKIEWNNTSKKWIKRYITIKM